jgi:hypothetical protein
MAKKTSISSRAERIVRVNSEDIFNKPLTKRQRAVVERHAARQAAGDDSHINFEDIPPLTVEQLAGLIRLRDRQPKTPGNAKL